MTYIAWCSARDLEQNYNKCWSEECARLCGKRWLAPCVSWLTRFWQILQMHCTVCNIFDNIALHCLRFLTDDDKSYVVHGVRFLTILWQILRGAWCKSFDKCWQILIDALYNYFDNILTNLGLHIVKVFVHIMMTNIAWPNVNDLE